MSVRYYRGVTRPALQLWLQEANGLLIDFSSGWTFELKLGVAPRRPQGIPGAAVLTKTTGIAGAAGAGEEPNGTPNVVVTWAGSELDHPYGSYVWQLKATTGGNPRIFAGLLDIVPVL